MHGVRVQNSYIAGVGGVFTTRSLSFLLSSLAIYTAIGDGRIIEPFVVEGGNHGGDYNGYVTSIGRHRETKIRRWTQSSLSSLHDGKREMRYDGVLYIPLYVSRRRRGIADHKDAK